VRIDSKRFKKLVQARGMSVEQLASVVARVGLKGRENQDAVSAVGNWMAGRDQPKCKPGDIRKLAGALGVEVHQIAKFQADFFFHRGSPRKVGLIVDMIRGKKYETALNLVTFTPRRAAVDVKTALQAALADAEAANADLSKLVVVESSADDGPRMKRFQPKDRGRAHRILKRMTHIKVSLVQKD
jgi:large subunit ribosomal protein L22